MASLICYVGFHQTLVGFQITVRNPPGEVKIHERKIVFLLVALSDWCLKWLSKKTQRKIYKYNCTYYYFIIL